MTFSKREVKGPFLVKPEYKPKSDKEKHARASFYVNQLATSALDLLVSGLQDLRRSADKLPAGPLADLARKSHSNEEMDRAVKEIICAWIFQEIVDQGQAVMNGWLSDFIGYVCTVSDHIIPSPSAFEVLSNYETSADPASICMQSCNRACLQLGFGQDAEMLAPALISVLLETQAMRQDTLKSALTRSLAELEMLI